MLSPHLALCQHVQMCLLGDVELVELRDIALLGIAIGWLVLVGIIGSIAAMV
jgi:hypothetical protein